jgi:hypothetical protein
MSSSKFLIQSSCCPSFCPCFFLLHSLFKSV